MKHPPLGLSETPLHLQPREKKGERDHHKHLEGNEWPLPKPGLNIEAIDRKEGIMLVLPKHQGKPPSEDFIKEIFSTKRHVCSVLSLLT